MRPDMHKIIVERPRHGSRGPFRPGRGKQNASDEDLPSKEGSRQRYRGSELKALNENLAPLKRFLRKQVGRPWNKVYSDISKRLRPASAVQQHVRDHLWDFVERNATIGADGRVYGSPGSRGLAPRPLRAGELYIHPTTGLLMATKPAKRRRGR